MMAARVRTTKNLTDMKTVMIFVALMLMKAVIKLLLKQSRGTNGTEPELLSMAYMPC